ncbi:unnamed protein product, partial [Rotaria sp. Silwood2]
INALYFKSVTKPSVVSVLICTLVYLSSICLISKEMISTLQQLLTNALQDSRKQIGQVPVEKYPSQVTTTTK